MAGTDSQRAAELEAMQGTSYRRPAGILRSIRDAIEGLVGGPKLTQDDLFGLYKTWKIMDREARAGSTAGAYKAKAVGAFPEWVQTQGRVDTTTLQSFMSYVDKWKI